MKITKKKYESAKKAVEAAQEQQKLVQTWERVTEGISGDIEAITVEGDSVRYEIVRHKAKS